MHMLRRNKSNRIHSWVSHNHRSVNVSRRGHDGHLGRHANLAWKVIRGRDLLNGMGVLVRKHLMVRSWRWWEDLVVLNLLSGMWGRVLVRVGRLLLWCVRLDVHLSSRRWRRRVGRGRAPAAGHPSARGLHQMRRAIDHSVRRLHQMRGVVLLRALHGRRGYLGSMGPRSIWHRLRRAIVP